jgi:hypothetical protein
MNQQHNTKISKEKKLKLRQCRKTKSFDDLNQQSQGIDYDNDYNYITPTMSNTAKTKHKRNFEESFSSFMVNGQPIPSTSGLTRIEEESIEEAFLTKKQKLVAKESLSHDTISNGPKTNKNLIDSNESSSIEISCGNDYSSLEEEEEFLDSRHFLSQLNEKEDEQESEEEDGDDSDNDDEISKEDGDLSSEDLDSSIEKEESKGGDEEGEDEQEESEIAREQEVREYSQVSESQDHSDNDLHHDDFRKYLVKKMTIDNSETQSYSNGDYYNASRMKKIDLSHLSKDGNTIFVKGAMGIGKTKFLIKLMRGLIRNRFLPSNFRSVSITPRRSLSSDQKLKFQEFGYVLYLENPKDQSRYISQLEALGSYDSTKGAPLLLIMDEALSVIEQINSSGSKQSFLTKKAWDIFVWLMKASKHVILLDALMDDRFVELFKKLRSSIVSPSPPSLIQSEEEREEQGINIKKRIFIIKMSLNETPILK